MDFYDRLRPAGWNEAFHAQALAAAEKRKWKNISKAVKRKKYW